MTPSRVLRQWSRSEKEVTMSDFVEKANDVAEKVKDSETWEKVEDAGGARLGVGHAPAAEVFDDLGPAGHLPFTARCALRPQAEPRFAMSS
jgi:hypothetical protein